MANDLPYRAEYAKSGRARCRGCKTKIGKGELRLATMVQSPCFDGKQPNWFHFDCFFERYKPKALGDFAHVDQIRWKHQEEIKSSIEGKGTDKSGSSKAAKTETKNELPYFCIEYAQSSRSTCIGCGQKIDKNNIRISKNDYEGEQARRNGPQDLWHHVDCFVSNRDELEFSAAADKLNGFKELNQEDQELLKTKLPALKTATKRPAKDVKDEPDRKKSKQEKDEEAKLKKQNQVIFGFRDNLEHQLKKKELQLLLEYNDMQIPRGESRMLDRLSDAMTFGVILSCPECKDGPLVYHTAGYRCHGNMTAWTRCTNITKSPKRKQFEVPEELKENYPFLRQYKYVKKDRIFPTTLVPSSSEASSSSSAAGKPLSNMRFVIVGKMIKPKAMVVKAIEDLGGKIVTKIDNTVAAVISTKGEVEKMSKEIEEAKAADIQVVSEEYIEAVKNGGAAILITEKSICNWGADPHLRIVEPASIKKKSGSDSGDSMFTKSMPSTRKMKLKGDAAVDPDSELEDVAHVLEVNEDIIYNENLVLVDLAGGINSFYKLQILEGDKSKRYWLFRSWGRVGTSIGGKKVEEKKDREDAIQAFHELYLKKTGNRFGKKSEFFKHRGKFYPLDIDYGQDNEKIIKLKEDFKNSKSKLEKPIQDLIRMIFDVESMQKFLVEFEIDLKKMPLGKLSRKQIEKAYSVLTELQQLVQTKASPPKFLDAANRFYTLIPHNFGVKKLTPLDNDEIIKQKIEMLDNLLEIEVAYNLLPSGDDSTMDPVDAYYQKLQTDLEVLDRTSTEFQLIEKYVKNSHAQMHNQYGLDIVEVFKVNRHGEDKRYKPFKKLHNRKLLWHGSRVTNFAGILSQGLCIAPPEAPASGYMFGKGVYFADMVSKSANYCCTNKSNPIGLMLLCEVALGNMHELTNGDFITKLPRGKHSTKGIGKIEPFAAENVTGDDGVEIPLGKGVQSSVANTSLQHNEYIVYDVKQINVKYLLKMNFNWRY